jgi:hypothetical protein
MSERPESDLLLVESKFTIIRRSRLLRWSAGYACGAWLVLQGFNLLDANYDWPESLMKLVPALLAAGLPAVALFAWAYDQPRVGTTRRTAGLLLLTLISSVAGATLALSTHPKTGSTNTRYLSPEGRPITPVLRSWPNPLLDAMVLGALGRRGRYAASGAEHRQGLIIEPGDLLIFSVLFRNEAAQQGRGWEVAYNVRLVMGVDTSAQRERVVTVGIAGDNLQTVYTGMAQTGSNLRLRSATPLRLVYVPGSTQVCMKKGTNVHRVSASFQNLMGECAGSGDSTAIARFMEDGIVERKAALGQIPALHTVTVVFGMRVVDAEEMTY